MSSPRKLLLFRKNTRRLPESNCIFIYHAPLRSGGRVYWNEALRANTQEWAIYAAGLLYNAGTPSKPDSKPVVKVVRYGLTFLALLDEHAVDLCEQVIAKQQE